MRLNHSLLLTIPAAALFLSACSKVDDTAASSGDAAAESAAGNADPAGPAIAGIVAPGVAFAYRYAFSLPGDAIAKVQQQHAAACEKLGTARCRVTGMSYEQPREGEIAAEIDFLLAPDIAHSFGSAGIEAVTGAKGKLDNASISGAPTALAISWASTVLPVPGSPLTSKGRRRCTAALTATFRSSVAT